MAKIISLSLLFLTFSAFGSEKFKEEIIDLINSNLTFYSKVTPGMGVTGEIISDYLDEEGNYLNCTVAIRGKDILLNNVLYPEYEFHYQEHWIDLNIKEGNECDPDMFPKEIRKFVMKEKKRDPLYLLKFLDDQENLNIEKIDEKKYLFKYTILDAEGEEFKQESLYDLNFPLYMNPEANGFKHKVFETQSLDLKSISLCETRENEDVCSEDQNLTFLLNR